MMYLTVLIVKVIDTKVDSILAKVNESVRHTIVGHGPKETKDPLISDRVLHCPCRRFTHGADSPQ